MTSNTKLVIHRRAGGVLVNGRYYPFKQKNVLQGTSFSPRPNTRFYVHSVLFAFYSTGITAGGDASVTSTLDSAIDFLAYLAYPAQTQATDIYTHNYVYLVERLMDPMAKITASAKTGSVQVSMVTYAEIDDV